MKKASIKQCVVAWTPASAEAFDYEHRSQGEGTHPTAGQLTLIQWPDIFGWASKYAHTAGGDDWQSHTQRGLHNKLLALFHTLVIRDGLDPNTVHEVLLSLREYEGGSSGGPAEPVNDESPSGLNGRVTAKEDITILISNAMGDS